MAGGDDRKAPLRNLLLPYTVRTVSECLQFTAAVRTYRNLYDIIFFTIITVPYRTGIHYDILYVSYDTCIKILIYKTDNRFVFETFTDDRLSSQMENKVRFMLTYDHL